MRPSLTRLVYRLPPTISRLSKAPVNSEELVSVTGFVKSVRRQKRVSFAVISDGSSAQGLQAVFGNNTLINGVTNGASVRLTGKLVESPGQKQDKELLVEATEILGECDPEVYPIQKQQLSLEHLRENLHLRTRTTQFAAVLRLRSRLMRLMLEYFDMQGFQFTHTPILTANDAEGAGETFRIAQISKEGDEFFGRPAHLTVSSQLHLEALASGLSRVYTLSPCFRAERSQTNRHLAEFWMLEPEWVDVTGEGLQGICSFVEDSLKSFIHGVSNSDDFEVLWKDGDETRKKALESCLEKDWTRMTYTQAVKLLSDAAPSTPFEFEPRWGASLQSEHERHLAEVIVRGPVFVTDYPKELKPFYMRENADGKTVACFDLLVPYVGELAGGSMREERPDVLARKMEKDGMGGSEYAWYQDLRKYGGVPHGGYGMGFERLVSWLGGIDNVRECIPMPRSANKLLL
ncbi:asparaginyl-tRNA synthetase [Hymenopellis radicata]|nr:asparaginyl-tRNA synthetase [Hymenopellis radicata]